MQTYKNFGNLQPIIEDIVKVVAEYSNRPENVENYYASDVNKEYVDTELGECFHCTISTMYLGAKFKIAEVSAISFQTSKFPPRNFEFDNDFYTMYRFRKTDEKCYLYKAVFVLGSLQGYVRHSKKHSYGISMIKFFTDSHNIPIVPKKSMEVSADYVVEDSDNEDAIDAYLKHNDYPLWDELHLVLDPSDYDSTEYSMDSSIQNVFTTKSLITRLTKCGITTMRDVFRNDTEFYETELGAKMLPDFYVQLSNTYK